MLNTQSIITKSRMKRLFLSLVALVACMVSNANPQVPNLPCEIYSGAWKGGHVQGIALDAKQEFVYISFTTQLVKLDLKGNVVGTVTGLLGHLGCLDFNEEDGRVYGSLEFKNDVIGKNIIKASGTSKQLETGFYVAIFDVSKINRVGMDAEKDGVMTTVFLKTVVEDYKAKVKGKNGEILEHRHGCSGFDGISFGPSFDGSGKRMLTIAYGIYGDVKRTDNDYQILLQYDTSNWAKYEAPLLQDNMHHRGPSKPNGKYYVFTGNTNWGVQNLEYDKDGNRWFLACYPGKKECFSNYNLFVVDGNKKPSVRPLYGVGYEKVGPVLNFVNQGKSDSKDIDVRGWHNKLGAYGVCALGNGYFYLASGSKTKDKLRTATLHLARYTGGRYEAFELITE